MLANNNRRIIRRLARNNLRSEWRRTLLLFVAIVLATVLLFGVLTMGSTYLQLSRLQDTRVNGGENDIIIANGFTTDQLALLESDDRVESVGQQAYAGFIQGTDADETVGAGLIWDDRVLWEQQRAMVITAQDGHYPTAANEVMASRDALAACGIANAHVGDRFTATVETNVGVTTQEFIISGIWAGYGDTSPIYVSRAFFDRSGYDLAESGILSIKLAHDFVPPQTIDDLQSLLELNEMQVFQPSNYIDGSWKVLLGVIGLSLAIAASAYLLIYNILYLSAAGKSRYYGLLQVLGMTERQVAQMVRRQMLGIAVSGLVAGLALGAGTSLAVVPRVLSALGITETLVAAQFHSLVFVLTVSAVGAAVLAGLHTPLALARSSSMIASLKRLPFARHSAALGHGKQLIWRLALAELCRNPKKTAVVLASLALSLSVFICLSTVTDSQDERTVMPLYWDADLLVRNDSETSEDIDSYQPLLEGLADEIRAVSGVDDVHEVMGIPFTLSDDGFAAAWLRAYSENRPYLVYDEVLADFRADPSRYYGMLRAVDEEEFDHLNAQLAEPVDRDAFLAGEICLAAAGEPLVPEEAIGETLTVDVRGQHLTLEIAAEVFDTGDLAASRNIGPNLIVSSGWAERFDAAPIVTNLSVHYDAEADTVQTEAQVMEILSVWPDLGDIFVQSHLEEVQAIQQAEGDLNETGAAIALLLFIVGMLNYVNTIAASIQSRRLTFSVMESLGMTPGQIRCQLLLEGLLIAAGVCALTATVGMGMTVLVFQMMNHMGAPFTLPLLPICAAVVLVVLRCATVPLVCYSRLADEGALMQRLRMSE